MKKNKQYFHFLIALFLMMLVNISPLKAQCPLCKAQVESSLNEGSNSAKGLNKGILILLASPYILIGTIGFIWYRRNQRAKEISQA